MTQDELPTKSINKMATCINATTNTRANNTPDDGALEALEWVKDAFQDIDESRMKLRRTTPILDRAEKCLKTIRQALSKPSVDVDKIIPDFVKNCKNAPMLDNEDHGLLACFIDHLHQQGHITDNKPEKPETIKCSCGVIFTSKTKMINLDETVEKLEEVLKE